jgi:hypothetical protein
MKIKPIFKVFLGLSILLAGISSPLAKAEGFSLELIEARELPLSTQENQVLKAFLQEAEEALPGKLKEKIGRKIFVEFTRLDAASELLLPVCNGAEGTVQDPHGKQRPDQIFGETVNEGKVRVSALFIPEILAGPLHSRSYPCGHHSLYRLALGTVVHEVAHVYDEGRRDTPSSRDPFYQRVAGWKTRTSLLKGIFREPRAKNLVTTRSPEAYENLDIQEHFAVNFQYFILDPEYRCRRPALYGYFSRHFGFVPPLGGLPECEVNTELPVNALDVFSDQEKALKINLSRVYEIHFMPALQGRSMASRWGHSMFRIVICGPNTPMGPECRMDISHHLVLSYSAFIEDSKINNWTGLTGGYPSQAFIFPLSEVVDRYTRGEFRDVWSLPIQMTEEQKRLFVFTALEHYWGYRGDYYFLSNNCNTESVDLLKGVFCSATMEKFSPWTPMKMVAKLNALGLIDQNLMEDEASGLRAGLFFPSAKRRFLADFQGLKRYLNGTGHSKVFNWEKLEDYFQHSTSAQRWDVLQLITQAPARVRSQFRNLETYIEALTDSQFKMKAFTLLEKLALASGETESLEKNLYEAHVRVVRQSATLSLPQRGYGIPLPQDFDHGQKPPRLPEEIQDVYARWQAKNFPELIREMSGIQRNLEVADR